MNKLTVCRRISLAMTMVLAFSALPVAGSAVQTDQPVIYETKKDMTPILGTHVTIEGFVFPYTGQEICPEVTVTVGDVTLEAGKHYTLSYKDNLAAGEASVTVTGIEEAGYTGIVTIPFTIESETTTLTEILGTHVTLETTTYTYTGQPIVPAVTVKIEDTVLEQDKDYTVTCENNTQPGTATLTVEGIATASMTQGYTGKVVVEFTIVEENQGNTEATEKPGESETEEETTPVSYKITKGDKATWYQNSGKTLSFTANGKRKDFEGVSINGKALDKRDYTAQEDTVVTLKTDYLKKLATGKYTVTLHFADGTAEGTFTVSNKLDPSNPGTGDSSAVGLWLTLSLGSLAALGGMAVLARKRK